MNENNPSNPSNIPQEHTLPSDHLETMSGANPSTPDVTDESATSESDAGLDDVLLDEAEIGGDVDLPQPGEVGEDDKSEYSRREIPMSDLPDAPREDFIHSPELSDLNVPGEIDIEDLDEDSVTESLPPDARLNPIED